MENLAEVDVLDGDTYEEETIEALPDDALFSYSKSIKKEFDNLFPTEYQEFTEEDYKELNKNVILYKDGNAEATQYIVSVFHRFIKKYADFICYGYYGDKTEQDLIKYRKQYDKSLSKFIGLFMSREKRLLAVDVPEKNKLFTDTCAKIQKLFSKFEYWDIYNELVCSLLNMAKKYVVTQEGDVYHKKNGTFHMYVNKCFHFDAYNSLAKIIGDPLAHLEVSSIEEDFTFNNNGNGSYQCGIANGEDSINNSKHILNSYILKDTDTDKIIERMILKTDRQNALIDSTKLVLKEEESLDPYEMEALNFNWTNGSTCSPIFKCLSAYEREIIVLSYAQNKTDSEIASIYGCHRITIIKHKKIAIQKVKEEFKRKGM